MKKVLILLALSILPLFAFAEKTTTMYVAVQNAVFKEKKSYFSATVAKVDYGEAVKITSTSGKWAQATVVNGGKKGWISLNSLTKRKIKKSDFKASTDELALAGKGFSAEVEKNYKKTAKADYASVDLLEKATVSDDELLQFIKDGKLKGGAQ